jgi:hypothetical protein
MPYARTDGASRRVRGRMRFLFLSLVISTAGCSAELDRAPWRAGATTVTTLDGKPFIYSNAVRLYLDLEPRFVSFAAPHNAAQSAIAAMREAGIGSAGLEELNEPGHWVLDLGSRSDSVHADSAVRLLRAHPGVTFVSVAYRNDLTGLRKLLVNRIGVRLRADSADDALAHRIAHELGMLVRGRHDPGGSGEDSRPEYWFAYPRGGERSLLDAAARLHWHPQVESAAPRLETGGA